MGKIDPYMMSDMKKKNRDDEEMTERVNVEISNRLRRIYGFIPPPKKRLIPPKMRLID